MIYWIRIGEEGDFQPLATIDAVVECLREWPVGEVTGWIAGAIGAGLETTECYGYDLIHLFVGDEEPKLVRVLNGRERGRVEAALEAVCI